MSVSLLLATVLAIGGVASAQSAPVQPAAAIPVEAFAKLPTFMTLRLSPDGTKVAALIPGSIGAVAVLKLPDLKLVGGVRLDGDRQFVRYWWAGDDQLVAELGIRSGPLEKVSSTGELVAFDSKGEGLRYLLGQAGSRQSFGTRLGKVTHKRVFATVLDPLVNDPEQIIIVSYSIDAGEHSQAVVSRLNLKTSKLQELAVAPAPGSADFLLDREGRVRYVAVYVEPFKVKTWQRGPDQKEWQPVELPGRYANALPLAFSADGESVYLDSREFGPRSCLVRHVLASGERQKIACDDAAELDHVVTAFVPGGEPIAAVFASGKPQLRLLANGNPHGELLKLLSEAFVGKTVEIASVTRDGSRLLVHTDDDRTPGDYYVFNTATKAADYLAAEQEWLDPELMGERRPVHLKSRDGTPLYGFLTIPKGSDGKNLPLVVHPHGGPFDVRDDWSFDTDPQLLASRGYAVLQLNFRGSKGYGADFVNAGKRAWGTTMIDDLTDAVKWSIEQGYADRKRIAIFGGSYGGYAAMMSAVREPDLYRCVIAEAGIYDLKLLSKDSDITDFSYGRQYFDEAIAASEAEMVAQSPLTFVDRLKAPVLIIHGEDDRRAPFSQAKALRKALDERKLGYEWLVRSDEGHGYFKLENRIARDEKLLAFLDRYLGTQSKEPLAVSGSASAVSTP